jgi:hypothetical protein
MRKVFVVLLGLILCSFMVGCSEDETTTRPRPSEFQITTASVSTGYTCTPYNEIIAAVGGTEPYSYSVSAGTLPDGLSLTADGRIIGVVEAAGEWTFTVSCTDNSDTPETVNREYTLSVEVPANPSIAVFFDDGAAVCMSESQAFNTLDCYVFIMLEDAPFNCVRATEFKLIMTDADDTPLQVGQYFHSYVSYPQAVSVTMGDIFQGVAISFSRDMVFEFEGPIHCATFGLVLAETLDQISFKFEPSPSSGLERPIVATCDVGYPLVEVDGRRASINY